MPRLGEKSLVKANLELWLNDQLIRAGFYTTVPVGNVNSYGEDISRLIRDDDESFAPLTVFQSAFKEWVYESGVGCEISGVAPPIMVSGVWVNGIFRAKDTTSPAYSPTYGHRVDFRNGRVIFNNALSGSDVVQVEFTYKEFGVDDAASFENDSNPLLIQTKYKDNPQQTGVPTYPGRDNRTLPMVFIDMLGRSTEGYELGWKSLVHEFSGTLHIWSHDTYMLDLIEDTLAGKERDVIVGVDFNSAPQPLDYYGDKNPLFPSYSSFSFISSPYFWRRIYLEDVEIKKGSNLFNVLRSRVDFKCKVYPNF